MTADPTNENTTCEHADIQVAFDQKAAEGLKAEEVRQRWPRYCGVCSECGATVVVYASIAHYVYGDW